MIKRGAKCGKKKLSRDRMVEAFILSPPCSRCFARESDWLEMRNVNATVSYLPIVSDRCKRLNNYNFDSFRRVMWNLPRAWLSLWLIRRDAGTSVAISVGCFATAANRVACSRSWLLRIAWTATGLLLNWRLGAASARLRATVRRTARARSKKVYSIPITQHCVSSECLPGTATIRARAAATRRWTSASTATAVATLVLHQANAASIQFRVV